jgi:hypothetical protein
MRKLQRRFDSACARALLGLILALSPQAANSQDRGSSVTPTAVVADGAIWQPCTALPPDQLPAVQSAQGLLERLWLSHDRGYFAAYTMPGEKRNPFDLSPPTPDAGPRDGFVQARTPICLASHSPGAALTIRFLTRFYRFYEAGPGWSPPLRDGLLLEAAVAQAGTEWQARDTGSERSILLPEQKPRRADVATLPTESGWAEPMPGCGKRQRWNGSDCVARKR